MTINTEPDDLHAAKRTTIVAIARRHFVAHGYGATSMSSIAAELGGSKTTLWAYFRSKEALFAAVVDELAKSYDSALLSEMLDDALVQDTLARFGSAWMATALSTPVLQLHRLVIGEAGRFPEVAALFWERGIGHGTTRLAASIETQMARGELRSGHPATAARQFIGLCQSGSYQRVVLALEPVPDAATVARDVQAAVDSFVRAWSALGR